VQYLQSAYSGEIVPGNLNDVILKMRSIMAARTEPLGVMLDLHFNGSHSRVHSIVPDVDSLSSGYAGGAPATDTFAGNPLDARIGRHISAKISAATGIGNYVGKLGSANAGLMSETETGVALQYKARLGMFGGSAPWRLKFARLVVEHGGFDDGATKDPDGFAAKVADAAFDGLDVVFPLDIEPDPPVFKSPVQPEFLKGIALDDFEKLQALGPFVTMNNVPFTLTLDEWRANGTILQYQYADWDAPQVRDPFRVGDVFTTVYTATINDGVRDQPWGLLQDGTRVPLRNATRIGDAPK
jgi:hypothetical protein